MTCIPTEKKPESGSGLLQVISASRRTDLVGCYPDYLIEKLKEYPPEKVHTIVVWTKNPANMISPGPLRQALANYSQIYVHLTITGLGQSILEPKIPPWEKVVAMIPAIAALVKSPARISWRFDPIVSVEANGKRLSNYNLFPAIADKMRQHGISICRTSWVDPYRKVIRRMTQKGLRLINATVEERLAQAKRLEQIAAETGIMINYCAIDRFKLSRCIDGKLLSRLHPEGIACSLQKAKGQRKLCGCTQSLDIGWYSLKCRNGCLYCYAEPLIA